MLIVGAMAVVRYAERNGARRPWLVQMLGRRKPKVAAVARGYHQGQRSVTALTGRTQDCTRPMPDIKSPLATREPSTQDNRVCAKANAVSSSLRLFRAYAVGGSGRGKGSANRVPKIVARPPKLGGNLSFHTFSA